MKKIFFVLISITFCFFISSCKKALKDVNDYFPKITTVSATVQNDGTVLVKGTIEWEGDSSIKNAGFCYSTNNDPKILNGQKIADINGNSFSVIYQANFHVDSVYYFKTWARNNYGYSYGNTISLDSIIAPAVTAPCNVTIHTVSIGGGQPTEVYYTVSQPTQYLGVWSFSAATSSGPTVDFKFGSALTTGVYTTTSNATPGAGQVNVSFYSGFINGTLSSGSSIYVNTIGSSVYDVVICNAPWTYNSSTLYFKTHLVVPY